MTEVLRWRTQSDAKALLQCEMLDSTLKAGEAGSNLDRRAAFRLPVRVYYEDTDAGGVVYYGNYLKFFERCRTEWLRALGVDQAELMRSQGLQFLVTDLQARYLSPAQLDDEIAIDARVVHRGRCSLVFEQTARRGDCLLVTARVKVACIDARRRTPARLPDTITERLSGLAGIPGN